MICHVQWPDDMENDREIHRKHFSDALFYTNRTPEELAHFSWKRPHQLVRKSHCNSHYHSSILPTSENILKFCDVQATKRNLLNWTQLHNCRCKCEDPIWCSQISNWIRLRTVSRSKSENPMSIKWFVRLERSKLIPRWTIPGYLWTGPAGETLSRCFHKSTRFLIQHKLIKIITY